MRIDFFYQKSSLILLKVFDKHIDGLVWNVAVLLSRA